MFDAYASRFSTRRAATVATHAWTKALPTVIPVSGLPPASIITPYAISATRLLCMGSMVDLR